MRDEITKGVTAKPDLKPANENPWYVLMTLYGEQEGESIDEDVHKKNKSLWQQVHRVVSKSGGRGKEFVDVFLEVVGTGDHQEAVDLHRREMLRRNGDGFDYPGFPDCRNPTYLNRLIFSKPVCLDGFYFAQELLLSESKFLNGLTMSGSVIREGVDAIRTHVFKELIAMKTSFEKGANFKDADLLGFCDFKSSTFKGLTIFSGTKFLAQENGSGTVTFENSRFEESTLFSKTEFQIPANFVKARFGELARFDGAEFTQEARFGRAIFEQGASFSTSKFQSMASLAGVKFQGNVSFDKAEFRASSATNAPSFSEYHFEKPVSFSQAVFSGCYPLFYGAILHDKTTFTKNTFGVPYWPDQTLQKAQTAKDSCAIIRHAVAKQSLPEEEHFFFRREMQFVGQIGSRWQQLPYRAFGLFSDYGHSIARPIWWLLAVWFVGFAYLVSYFSGDLVLSPKPQLGQDIWTAAGLSFSNLFPLFGFGRLHFKEVLVGLPPVLKFLSGLQTVISLPLLFFLGLGLRQRFRLR